MSEFIILDKINNTTEITSLPEVLIHPKDPFPQVLENYKIESKEMYGAIYKEDGTIVICYCNIGEAKKNINELKKSWGGYYKKIK